MGMTYLLDTHALLGWLFGDRHISATAEGVISSSGNQIWASSASAWEIATKHRIGKLSGADALVHDISGWIAKAGFIELPITARHAQKAGGWPVAHRDPFDRMLAAQSALENVPLVSSDTAMRQFGIPLVW